MGGTHVLDRWLYRGRHPNRLARLIMPEFERIAAQYPVFHVTVAEGTRR